MDCQSMTDEPTEDPEVGARGPSPTDTNKACSGDEDGDGGGGGW